jgi:hypothetical protein
MVGEGVEVVEPGGGLGAFEAVTDILLVLIGGLDVIGDMVLLPGIRKTRNYFFLLKST